MKKTLKGITLVEIIIVLAILGILASILIPSVLGYVTLAKKKATVVNGKTIYMAAMRCITTNDEARDSFYNTQHNVRFEATPEGTIVLGSRSYYDEKEKQTITRVISNEIGKNAKMSAKGNYPIVPICRVDGISHTKGNVGKDPRQITNILNTWTGTDKSSKKTYDPFVKALCAEDDMSPNEKDGGSFPLPMPYQGRDDGGENPLIRWIICYNQYSEDKVEVWAGDGYKSENGPVYRVYPNPADNYA